VVPGLGTAAEFSTSAAPGFPRPDRAQARDEGGLAVVQEHQVMLAAHLPQAVDPRAAGMPCMCASLSRAAVPLIGLALVSTVVATVAFQLGLARVGAASAAILSCWEVVVTCAVAAIALGDRLTPARIAGCAAILLLNRPPRVAAPPYPIGRCGQPLVDGAAVGYPTTKFPEDHSGCWLATDAP
jgi:hypothetical protein